MDSLSMNCQSYATTDRPRTLGHFSAIFHMKYVVMVLQKTFVGSRCVPKLLECSPVAADVTQHLGYLPDLPSTAKLDKCRYTRLYEQPWSIVHVTRANVTSKHFGRRERLPTKPKFGRQILRSTKRG